MVKILQPWQFTSTDYEINSPVVDLFPNTKQGHKKKRISRPGKRKNENISLIEKGHGVMVIKTCLIQDPFMKTNKLARKTSTRVIWGEDSTTASTGMYTLRLIRGIIHVIKI